MHPQRAIPPSTAPRGERASGTPLQPSTRIRERQNLGNELFRDRAPAHFRCGGSQRLRVPRNQVPQVSNKLQAPGNGLYGGPITLTSYIWEYLGNPCPVGVCQ